MRYLTPEVVKAIALCAVAAAPGSMLSKKAEDRAVAAEEQTGYANANNNATLGILAVVVAQVDSLKREVRVLKAQQARTYRNSPQGMTGPLVPNDWLPAPPKKKHWWNFGG